MNGFTLWVLLAATGQVGDGIERDKGWQIHPEDGLLEYVVQLSPEKANIMHSAKKEFQSDVPAYVAARLSRVVVRIGTEPIISAPVEEVMRLRVISTDVLANIEETAGRGRFSQLEADPSAAVINVNNPGGSAPPASLSDSSRALPPDSLLAQNAPSSFANEARGVGTTPNKYANTGSPPSTALPGSGTQLPAAQTGIAGPSLPSSNFPTSPTTTRPGGLPNSNFPNTGIGSSGTGSSGIGSSQNSQVPGNYAGNNAFPSSTASQPYGNPPQGNQSHNNPLSNNQLSNSQLPNSQSPYAQGGYTQPASQFWNQTPNYSNSSTSSGNFGSVPSGGLSQPFPPNQYATMGTGVGSPTPYNQTPYSQPGSYVGLGSPLSTDPHSLPSYSQQNYQQSPRIADTRAAVPLPSTGLGGAASTTLNRELDRPIASSPARSSYDPYDTHEVGPSSVPRGMDNIVPVMFVLSLVVNFYLGMLIRKLLTRYRSLLSSVRGQAV